MSYMFSYSSFRELDLSNFNTSKTTNTAGMFNNAKQLTKIKFPSIFGEKSTNMSNMFYSCYFLTYLDLTSFDTRLATNMGSMFYGDSSLMCIKVSDNFVVSQVTSHTNMFYNCKVLVGEKGTKFNSSIVDKTYALIDGGKENPGYLSKDKVMEGLYWYVIPYKKSGAWTYYELHLSSTEPTCQEYKDNYGGDNYISSAILFDDYKLDLNYYVDRVVIDNVIKPKSFREFFKRIQMTEITNFDYIDFSECDGDMTSMFESTYMPNFEDLSFLKNVPHIISMSGFFAKCQKMNQFNFPEGIDWSQCKDMSHLFEGTGTDYQAGYLRNFSIPENLDTQYCEDFSYMFAAMSYLETIDLSRLNTTNAKNYAGMFKSCYNLPSVDTSVLNTSNVTDFHEMFYGCSKMVSIDVSSFDTSKATDLSSMFSGCRILESVDVSHFNTSNCENFKNMFEECRVLRHIDVSNFDTSKSTSFYYMFNHCEALESIDVSNFSTSNATSMRSMFCYCKLLKEIDVSGFDTSNVTDIFNMFAGCESIKELDLSNFDTRNVTDMGWVFDGCSSLEYLNLESFQTDNTKPKDSYDSQFDWMFRNCHNLKRIYVSSGSFAVLPYGGYNPNNNRNYTNAFEGCNSLIGMKGTTLASNSYIPNYTLYAHIDGQLGIYISNVPDYHQSYGYFTENIRYNVSFETFGGGEIDSQDVLIFRNASTPSEIPTKDYFVFAGWYVDRDYTIPFDFNNEITSDITLYAKFVADEYDIEKIDSPHGDFNVKTEATYSETVLVLDITPDTGFLVQDVVVTKVGGGNVSTVKIDDTTYKFVMPGEKVSVEVIYIPIDYNIEKEEVKGTFIVDKTVATLNEVVRVRGITADTGYKKNGIEVKKETDGTTVLAEVEGDGYKFNMPAENVKVKVIFTPEEYDITKEAENGTFATDKTVATYTEIVRVSGITAEEGYRFNRIEVNGGAVPTDTVVDGSEYTFRMPAEAVNVKVIFTPEEYTIEKEEVKGTFIVDKTVATLNEVVRVRGITADTGYKKNGIEVKKETDGTTVLAEVEGDGYKFNMPAENVKVKVIFERLYNVIRNGEPSNGNFSFDKSSAFKDTKIYIDVIPNSGYHTNAINVIKASDSMPVSVGSENNRYCFVMPDDDVKVSVSFEKNSSGGGSSSGGGGGSGSGGTLLENKKQLGKSKALVFGADFDKICYAVTKGNYEWYKDIMGLWHLRHSVGEGVMEDYKNCGSCIFFM